MQRAPGKDGATRVPVLHVVDSLDVGGAEVHCLRLAAALDRQKYDVHVAYGASGALESLVVQVALRSFRFADRKPELASFDSLRPILRLYRYIQQHHIRIVHTYLYTGHVIASLAALAARVPVVEHVHDQRYERLDNARRERQYHLARLIHSLAARTVVLTPDNLAAVSGGKTKESCVLLPNGVPEPIPSSRSRSALCMELGFPPETALCLVAGRLTAIKDVALALRSFARACAEAQAIGLLIIGDGPARGELMQLADALSVASRVRFLGSVENLYDWLPHCAALVHPSHVELNSLTILEAMRCGVPVIARGSVSGNRVLIQDRHTGRLIESGDETAWARAIVELACNPEMRAQMGEAARRQALEHFDLRIHTRRIEAIYDSLDCH